MTCPTVGDQLARIACELHESNQATQAGPLDLVTQVAIPLATLFVAVVALLFAVRSFHLAREASREERARNGREERVKMQLRCAKACRQRWGGGGGDLEQTWPSFESALHALEQSPAVRAPEMALTLWALNDVFAPAEGESRLPASRKPAIAAEGMLAAWVEDPRDQRSIDRMFGMALRAEDAVELKARMNRAAIPRWRFVQRARARV